MADASPALLAARAAATLQLLDADTAPAALQIWSGGRPDLGAAVDSIPAHQTDTAYTQGDYVTAGLDYYRAENSGTSGSTAPAWPTDGNTIADGDITWQHMGATPELLGVFTFSQPAGSLSGHQLTLTPATETPKTLKNGTASWSRLVNGAGTLVYEGIAGLPESGAFVELNTLELKAGGDLLPTSLLIEG